MSVPTDIIGAIIVIVLIVSALVLALSSNDRPGPFQW